MATFVLIHGAMRGGWCWQRLKPMLEQLGHTVFSPTLTGLGERVHLCNRSVDLSLHITDIRNVLVYEDLNDVILVGHSYGALVGAGVADAETKRIRHIVNLDAVAPQNGDCAVDALDASRRLSLLQRIAAAGDWLLQPIGIERLGIRDVATRNWAAERLTPQPVNTLLQRLTLSGPSIATLPQTSIICANVNNRNTQRIQTQAIAFGWGFRSIQSGHDAMLDNPAALAVELGDIATHA